jgi:hypothetical protein
MTPNAKKNQGFSGERLCENKPLVQPWDSYAGQDSGLAGFLKKSKEDDRIKEL